MNLLNRVNHTSESMYLISSFRTQGLGESIQLSPLFLQAPEAEFDYDYH